MRFIQASKNTTFDAKSNDVFELNGGANFFGRSDNPSKLFIRKCYNDLLDVVQDPNIRKLRISGNPGIGKTLSVIT